MVEMSKDLCKESRAVVEKVLEDNAYFAHPENLVIALLADDREELRRKGVQYVMAARYNEGCILKTNLICAIRRNFDPASHPRQFIPPKLNFKVK